MRNWKLHGISSFFFMNIFGRKIIYILNKNICKYIRTHTNKILLSENAVNYGNHQSKTIDNEMFGK